MGDKTAIEWTDATWNPLRGCSRVSEGCRHCYAERVAARFSGDGQPYAGLIHPSTKGWNGKTRFVESMLDQPLRWKRPRRIFVNSMSDLFHESVPDWWIDKIFAVMAIATQHTFQVLTKRPERMLEYLSASCRPLRERWASAAVSIWGENDPDALFDFVNEGTAVLPNVWLGTSAEDQKTANERIGVLLKCPAAVHWVSLEPLLGPVDLYRGGFSFLGALRPPPGNSGGWRKGLDWVVVGGESGPEARPMQAAWAQSLRDQCAAAGVPYLFKQWGSYLPFTQREAGQFTNSVQYKTVDDSWQLPKKIAGRLLDGVQHDGYPT